MNKNILTAFCLIASISCYAQPAIVNTIVPIERQRFHDRIREEQQLLDKADGSLDSRINISKNEEVNAVITDVMLRQIAALEDSVELNPALIQSSDKVRYLTCIEKLIRAFRTSPKAAKIKPGWAALLLDNFTRMAADVG